MKRIVTALFIIASLNAYSQEEFDPFDPFQIVLDMNNLKMSKVLQHPEKFELQIIYTEINRNKENEPVFTQYSFHLDANQYFYPASTVKMPTAFVALEKLNKLHIDGLTRNSKMKIGKQSEPQTAALSDSTAKDGVASLSHYIKKLFVVSDNDAYNRLYEFCGQAYLNECLHEKGYTDLHLIHRLAAPEYDRLTNRKTNPVMFYNENGPLYYQGEVNSWFPYRKKLLELEKTSKGVGFYGNKDTLINRPMNFGLKNYISLQNLNDILKAVLFPESVPPRNRFSFSETDEQFLLQSMSIYPEESNYPNYKDGNHPDGYVKFFMFGDSDEKISPNIRIFNKVGYAYGYLTDVAYIVDFDKGVEFMLAATLHVNENQIYNDGVYEYEQIGLPFLAELGRQFYAYECDREKHYLPDLKRFVVPSYE